MLDDYSIIKWMENQQKIDSDFLIEIKELNDRVKKLEQFAISKETVSENKR